MVNDIGNLTNIMKIRLVFKNEGITNFKIAKVFLQKIVLEVGLEFINFKKVKST